MPTTSLGITYPGSTSHARIWEHLQTLAQDVNTLLLGVNAPAMAMLRCSSGQMIPNNNFVSVNMQSEDLDTANGHSTSSSTSRYVVQTAGWYRLAGGVTFVGNGTGRRGTRWLKNGTNPVDGGDVLIAAAGTGAGGPPASSPLVLLQAGDYIELQVFQDSGSSLALVTSAANHTWMSVEWRRAP
ncbi:hypothetical protein [Micromonospora sp. WMMD980]|uniref:hypothetical protein n=1 Tax=Micromonospora sp. WMMD980 TaxID=3016088 RepID=UPI002415A00E|nr:hypothetical protein [Micromonospora sp. WMMD980]MDG4799058.1 hypothetical protein [Micromonospora sp. WMMD980]